MLENTRRNVMVRLDQRRSSIETGLSLCAFALCGLVTKLDFELGTEEFGEFDNKGRIWMCDRSLINNCSTWLNKWNARSNIRVFGKGKYIMQSISLCKNEETKNLLTRKKEKITSYSSHFFVLYRYLDRGKGD